MVAVAVVDTFQLNVDTANSLLVISDVHGQLADVRGVQGCVKRGVQVLQTLCRLLEYKDPRLLFNPLIASNRKLV